MRIHIHIRGSKRNPNKLKMNRVYNQFKLEIKDKFLAQFVAFYRLQIVPYFFSNVLFALCKKCAIIIIISFYKKVCRSML